MSGAGLEVAAQAAPYRLGVAPQAHRVDEPVAAAVGQVGLAEALAQPVVAVVLQHHVARQLLAAEGAGLGGVGLDRHLLLDRQDLAGAEDLLGDRGVLRSEETRLNSSHPSISYAVFCLKKKKQS